MSLEGLTAEDILLMDGYQVGPDSVGPGFERLVVYRDGRVAVLDVSGWDRSWEDDGDGETAGAAAVTSPPAAAAAVTIMSVMAWPPFPALTELRSGQLPECALTRLGEVAAELAPLVAELDGDLGFIMVTDVATLGVDYRGTPAVATAAYGLDFGNRHGVEDDLTPEQRRGRELMRELRNVVVDYTGPLDKVQPERVDVSGADGCRTISDADEVAALLAEDDSSGAGTVRALAPGTEGCNEGR